MFKITDSENEKNYLKNIDNNNNKQEYIIDLGQCENILREHYHIDNSTKLTIIKFEKLTNISKEKTLQYEVYEPINMTKLNLSYCDNTTISIYISVELSNELQQVYDQLKKMGYDLFDINSAFYQDICVPFTSPYGTDVLLTDRIAYYFHNNETVCQSNCLFGDYSMKTKYLKCDCDASNSEINTKEVSKFTSKTIYESFYDTLKFSNYRVLLCYKLPFRINSITTNKGSIMAIIYFCLYLIFLSIFCIKGITQFKLFIAKEMIDNPKKQNDDIILNNNIDIKKSKGDDKSLNESQKNIKSTKRKSRLSYSYRNSIRKRSSKLTIHNFPPRKSLSKNIKNKNRNSIYSTQKIYNEFKLSDNNLLMTNKFSKFKRQSQVYMEKLTEKGDETDATPKKELDHFELNDLDYEEAVKLDKRNFFGIYWSLLRREHLIIFTFFIRNDYNLIIIKLARFIFLVCTDMALNVFFFSDDSMHKLFLSYGKYDFVQQIPQITYSTIITQLIELFLCFLSLTDKHIYQIKGLKSKSKNLKTINSIFKCIKIKLIGYFVFTFIFFGIYWYIISSFCAVYENTQMAFIKDSLLSFCLSLLYPFVLYLIPSFLRIISLRANKSNLSFLYKLSDIIPIF